MAAPPIDPNLITLLRLPLAPAAVGFLVFWDSPWGVAIALVLSLLLEATDALDGFVARRYNAVSDFGKLFDPFSDAFARFTLFLGLWAIGAAHLWMILILFYRDSSISFFRSIAATRGQVMPARKTGKIKAIVQAIGVNGILVFLLAAHLGYVPAYLAVAEQAPYGLTLPWWVMLVVTIVTGPSFFDYLAGAWPILSAAWSNQPSPTETPVD